MRCALLLATATLATGEPAAERGQRGFMGMSSLSTQYYWPIRGCRLDRHCWPSQIRKYAGWKLSNPRNLQCASKQAHGVDTLSI